MPQNGIRMRAPKPVSDVLPEGTPGWLKTVTDMLTGSSADPTEVMNPMGLPAAAVIKLGGGSRARNLILDLMEGLVGAQSTLPPELRSQLDWAKNGHQIQGLWDTARAGTQRYAEVLRQPNYRQAIQSRLRQHMGPDDALRTFRGVDPVLSHVPSGPTSTSLSPDVARGFSNIRRDFANSPVGQVLQLDAPMEAILGPGSMSEMELLLDLDLLPIDNIRALQTKLPIIK